LVRALAEGRTAAERISQYLAGQELVPSEKTFSSIMGRVDQSEVEGFLKHASPNARLVLDKGGLTGLSARTASEEAARCLHCDCRAAGHCELQRYAEQYGADPNRYPVQRRRFEQQLQHGEILYEPGKCILCGICVQLTERAREPLGLTFIGRGFDVRVGAGLHRTIAEGLQKVARQCVQQCPTGALVLRDEQGWTKDCCAQKL
jgi:ferredoxin